MDVALVIRRRLKELGFEQRDLAMAAGVTESYISQLLARKKSPPSPRRTDVYDSMGSFLGLAGGELARLAELQRKEELKTRVADPPVPLFADFRNLILRKCKSGKQKEVLRAFGKEAFGELERLVTQKLLDVAKGVAKKQLDNQDWLRSVAELHGKSHEETRVMVLEFLDTDVFHVSVENCVWFLEPLIESWDIDLESFALDVTLNPGLTLDSRKRFEFTEITPEPPVSVEAGLEEFLREPSFAGDVTEDEIAFLKSLKFVGRQPTALYYYREMQSLRDPLHFEASPSEPKTASQANRGIKTIPPRDKKVVRRVGEPRQRKPKRDRNGP